MVFLKGFYMNEGYLTFFHHSDYLHSDTPSLFNPRLRDINKYGDIRPVFYWFNDSFFSFDMGIRNRYLYLFSKNINDLKNNNINFTIRGESKGFDLNKLFELYKENTENRDYASLCNWFKDGQVMSKFSSPPILFSYDILEPDLAIEFKSVRGLVGDIVYPEKNKGTEVKLFNDEHFPIRFNEIPEITNIITNISSSYPFIL